MRTVYATQFKVLPPAGQSLSGLAQELMGQVTAWVADRYARDGLSIDVNFDGTQQVQEPMRDHKIVTSVEAIDDHAIVILDWSYPHEPDESLLWQVQVSLAVSQGEVEVAILIRITSTRFAVQPLEYDLGRPRLVPALLRAFSCRVGAIPLPAERVMLASGDVRSFVADVLLHEHRAVPVVVVSPVVWTDETLVEPQPLQDALAGLAIVAQLESKWAAFELTDVLGRLYSCYNGAVRVYWPGLRIDGADGLEHQVFLPSVIRSNDERGRPLSRHLFRMFAGLGAFRFTEGDVFCRAREAIDKSRRARFNEIAEQAKAGDAGADKELLELALDENARLEKKASEDQARIAELEGEIATHRANWADVSHYQREPGPEEAAEAQAEAQPVETVIDALNEVGRQCGDILVIYKAAWESGEESDFARPEEVLKALVAIADVGRKYFKSKETKQPMGAWEGHFERLGLKYAPTDSEMTLNLYGAERRFAHDGKKIEMHKHLTLGKGDRKNCLQIYFEPNDNSKRIEIGYCGRHLQHYGQRT